MRNFIKCQRRYTSKLLVIGFEKGVEIALVELNLIKWRWLLVSLFNPHKLKIENHLNKIKISLNSFSSKHENFLLIGNLVVGNGFVWSTHLAELRKKFWIKKNSYNCSQKANFST